jgi:hypothetical protein
LKLSARSAAMISPGSKSFSISRTSWNICVPKCALCRKTNGH